MKRKISAVSLSLLVSLIWALSFYFIDKVTPYFGPATIVLLRFLFGIFPFVFYNLITKKKLFVRKEDRGLLLLSSILGGGIYFLLTSISSRLLTSSQSVSIASLQLFLVLLVYSFVEDKVIKPRTVISVALISVGSVLVAKVIDFSASVPGTLIFLVATFMWVFYLFVMKKLLNKNDISTILFNQFFLSILMMVPLSIFEDNEIAYLIPCLKDFIFLGVICLTMAFTVHAILLKNFGVINTSIFMGINPVWIFLIDTFYFKISFNFANALGVIFIVIGATVVLKDVLTKSSESIIERYDEND